MAASCSDVSFTSSPTFSQDSEQSSFNSIDSDLSNGSAREAKVGKTTQVEREDLKQFQRMFSDALVHQSKGDKSSLDPTWKQQDTLALHRGLEAIASQLSLLTNTLGTALEEQRHHAEAKTTSLKDVKLQDMHMNGKIEDFSEEKHLNSPPKSQVSLEKMPDVSKDNQAKTSRELAEAMTTKAKLLLRELKRINQDLIFTKDRCTQLEEENKRLRESIDKGVRHEEDDLVRLQLEALLTEKARLAQENATYAKENQFLHEVVQYHQLKLRSITFPDDDSLVGLDDELMGFDGSPVDKDLVPLYPQDEDADVHVEEAFTMAKCT